jgi:chromosome partitioning protein
MHIVVINTKGGCGKTLVTTQLACYFACSGKTIAIVDHDPQQSSKDWVKARPKKCASISCAVAGKSAFEPTQADITIHDMPAGYDILQIKKDVPDVKAFN